MTRKKQNTTKQLSPLISDSCCRICFLLSGGCGCHSDEWGRSAERLYHSDRKHRDMAKRGRAMQGDGERERERERRRWVKDKGQQKEDEHEEEKIEKQNDNGGEGGRVTAAVSEEKSRLALSWCQSPCVNTHSRHQSGTTAQRSTAQPVNSWHLSHCLHLAVNLYN